MHRSPYVQEALHRTIHSTLCSDAAAVGPNGSHPSFGRGANVTVNCNCLFVCWRSEARLSQQGRTCPAAPPTTKDDALSDAMHARALPAHAPALNGCASRATHSPPFVTISAVHDAPRSVRNGSVRIRNRIGNTIHTHHQHDAPIARSRHSRARPAAVCERGRVPFQSPEIVETSSPCSPQKETNRRC